MGLVLEQGVAGQPMYLAFTGYTSPRGGQNFCKGPRISMPIQELQGQRWYGPGLNHTRNIELFPSDALPQRVVKNGPPGEVEQSYFI